MGAIIVRGLRRLARIVPTAVTIGFAVLQLTPLIPWVVGQMTEWDRHPTGGVLIVLGAEQHADGTLGMMSYWRCFSAVQVWRAGKFSKILVSGGPARVGGTAALAESMAGFLRSSGVPGDSLVVEAASSNTHENATAAAALLRSIPGPYTLITSDYHMLRASHCFRRAGIEVNRQPAPDILKRSNDWRQRWHCSIVLAEEWGKLAYYWWRGWI